VKKNNLGIGEIAQYDPRLAATLLYGGAFAPKGVILGGVASAVGGWEILNLRATFTSGTANQTLPVTLPDVAEVDMWVRDIRATVRRPNYFSGNPLRDIANTAYAKNPDIDFTLEIKTWCNFAISLDPTPLGNIEETFECVCPVGLVLTCGSSIIGSFTNTRALVDPDEIPTEAIISLHVTRLPRNNCYAQMDIATALAVLKNKGLFSPDMDVSCCG
jgi:hypothetical protein